MITERQREILGSTETSVTGSVTSLGRITSDTLKRSLRIWPVIKDHSGDGWKYEGTPSCITRRAPCWRSAVIWNREGSGVQWILQFYVHSWGLILLRKVGRGAMYFQEWSWDWGSEDDVYEKLCRIDPSKASGPDEIPGRLLRENALWIAEPLLNLFNVQVWNQKGYHVTGVGKILPLYLKKGNKDVLKNYHPVNLTSLVIKVMKCLILLNS